MPRAERPNNIVLDQWYAHESLDRMFLVMEMYGQYVLDHPFVEQTPELKERGDKLIEQMMEMYQHIGRVYGERYED